MQTLDIGEARIPMLGFGTKGMDGEDVGRMVPYALAAGFRHFDTAQIDINEAHLGRALALGIVPRSELFLTTKVWVTNYRSGRFLASVNESLDRLQTDHVDLLLLHWHSAEFPLSHQIAGLEEARALGKTRHIGVSNFTIRLLEAARRLAVSPIVTNQVEIHPFIDQSALLAWMKWRGVPATSYSGMAGGQIFFDRTIRRIAAMHRKTVAQVVLRWTVQRGIIALPKTTNPEHVAENIAIFDFSLSDVEMAEIGALARPNGRIVNPEELAPVWDR